MRLPPYAHRAILHRKLDGLGYWVFTGADGWSRAKSGYVPALVLPEGEEPESFRWPVMGFNTLIYRTSPLDPAIEQRLARSLLRAGAQSLIAVGSGERTYYAGAISEQGNTRKS